MSKKDIEHDFLEDIDSYLDGLERMDASKNEDYGEIFNTGKLLANKDFSKKVNKNYMYKKCLENINKSEGDRIMKKLNIVPKVAAAVVVAAIASTAFMQTSFAKDFSEKIKSVVSIGNTGVIQAKKDTKDDSATELPTPDYLKGKIFDKNGKPVSKCSAFDVGKYYTANGEKIAYVDQNNKIVTVAQQQTEKKIIKDINNIGKYNCFKVRIPSYLPNGYKFLQAEVYTDEKGNVSDKYITLIFEGAKNQKNIFLQERLDCPETQYYGGSDGPVKKIKINNVNVIWSNGGHTLDWKNNGCLYGLTGRSVSADEVEKVAESIK